MGVFEGGKVLPLHSATIPIWPALVKGGKNYLGANPKLLGNLKSPVGNSSPGSVNGWLVNRN